MARGAGEPSGPIISAFDGSIAERCELGASFASEAMLDAARRVTVPVQFLFPWDELEVGCECKPCAEDHNSFSVE